MNEVWVWLGFWWDQPLSKTLVMVATGAWVANVAMGSDKKRRRTEDMARRGIGTYLVTGKETEALGLNPGSVVEAAKQHRARHLKKKLKERKPFTAWCNCPKCNAFDVHWIDLRKGKRMYRMCRTCGQVWEQLI